ARRQAHKDRYQEAGVNLTYTAFITHAVAATVSEYPYVNASVDGDQIVYRNDINIGMAVALEQGLIVPVIRQADTCSLLDLSRTIADLAQRARTKQLKVEEVEAGTFTITNPGIFGGLWGLPIISQPQVAILAIGSIDKRAVVAGGGTGASAPAEAERVATTRHGRGLGGMAYDEAQDLQQQMVDRRRAGSIGDTLIFLEHPPVITLGARNRIGVAHILASRD